MSRDDGVAAFEAGKVDAVVFADSPEARVVQRLAGKDGVRLLSNARGEAYARKIPFVNRLQLARGVFDLCRDVPSSDVTLLAQTTNLVGRADLHPALGYLLLAAAQSSTTAPACSTTPANSRRPCAPVLSSARRRAGITHRDRR